MLYVPNPQPFELHHGDSLPFLRSLPSASVDAIICDPPYCSGGLQAQARTTQTPRDKYQNSETKRTYPHFGGDQRDQRGFAFWAYLWLSECHRVAREGAPVCLFSDWRQLPVITDVMQAADFIWRGVAVWDKTEGGRPARGRFAAQSEFVVWGSKGGMPIDRAVGLDGDSNCLPGVFRAYLRQGDKFHITGKPTTVMEQIVNICTPGGIILDPFSGSGTTGVAALQRGYRFVGVERESAYADIARRRLAEAVETVQGLSGARN